MGVMALPAAISDHYYKHVCAAIFTPSRIWTWSSIIRWARCNWPLTVRHDEERGGSVTDKDENRKIDRCERMKWHEKHQSDNRYEPRRLYAKWLMGIEGCPLWY